MAGKRYTARPRPGRPRAALRAARGGAPAEVAGTAKFDETVEVHMRLGVNVRHADQQLRGTLFLPHGLGKTVTVAVFAQGEKAKEAEEAGADFVGGDDLAARITEGWTDFDVAIATPDMMGTVGKLGRILGPQGKMPSPKAGTITFDIGKAVSDVKSGKIEYRTDRTGIIHVALGKKSFEEQALVENYRRRARGDPAREAGGGEGPLPALDHDRVDDGPGHQAGHDQTRDLLEEAAPAAARLSAIRHRASAPKTVGAPQGSNHHPTEAGPVWRLSSPPCVRPHGGRPRATRGGEE